MSEHIVHTAVLEDCLNFISISSEVSEDFRKIAQNYRDFAQLGSITVSGDEFTFKLLEKYKKKWENRRPEDLLEAKLAFIFGWVIHRAADRQMKPIWRSGPIKAIQDKQPQKPTECSVYHEAYIFREYYMDNSTFKYAVLPHEANSYAEKAGLKVEIHAVVTLLRAILKRTLIELHTLKPDREDVDGWLEKLFSVQQRFYIDIERYAHAIVNPEPEKLKIYVTDINFFDPEDVVLKLAKALRKDEAVTDKQITQAMSTDAKSHYGKALKLAYGYVVAASDYFNSYMSIDELKDRLDIGKPGRHGGGV